MFAPALASQFVESTSPTKGSKLSRRSRLRAHRN
jgi:hypothetical protein